MIFPLSSSVGQTICVPKKNLELWNLLEPRIVVHKI